MYWTSAYAACWVTLNDFTTSLCSDAPAQCTAHTATTPKLQESRQREDDDAEVQHDDLLLPYHQLQLRRHTAHLSRFARLFAAQQLQCVLCEGVRSPWRVCPASMWLWPSFGIGKVEGWPECLEYPIVQIFLADLVAVPPKIICMFFMWPFIFENVMAIPPQTCWNIIDILSDLAFLQS